MKFYLTDTKEDREITLRRWNGSNYEQDVFGDLAVDLPMLYQMLEGDTALCMTSAEYADLAQWWAEEVRAMNAHALGQNGADYSESDQDGYELFAE